MTREQAKLLSPVIKYFADGGNLWCYTTQREWIKQSEVLLFQNYANIIEDKHFEARKAFALGEDIEKRAKYQDNSTGKWYTDINPTWNNISYEYRPKPKEPVYEWQWIFKRNKSEYGMSSGFYSVIAEELDWVKFEPSKRIRH